MEAEEMREGGEREISEAERVEVGGQIRDITGVVEDEAASATEEITEIVEVAQETASLLGGGHQEQAAGRRRENPPAWNSLRVLTLITAAVVTSAAYLQLPAGMPVLYARATAVFVFWVILGCSMCWRP